MGVFGTGRRGRALGEWKWLLIAPMLLVLACGPATTSPGAPAASQPLGSSAPAAPAAPKTITMALKVEPPQITTYGRPMDTGSDQEERWTIFHANLTQFDPSDNPYPVLAQKVPSISDGDWNYKPDGTMEVTWKLNPNAVWQDGTPLSAQDFVFGYQVVTDPKVAAAGLGDVLKIASVQAPDDHTLVVDWKQTSVWGNANGNDGFPALPRHLLQDVYQGGDIAAFQNSLYWRDQWVGLGPYKLTTWESGSHMELAAFDQYVLGRPKIDQIVLSFIPDPSVVLVNVLAGAVDVVTPSTNIKPDQISELLQNWVPDGKGTAETRPSAIRALTLNFLDPNAAWVKDPRVRQAMIEGMDRENMVDTLQYGLTSVANYMVMPTDPVSALAEQRVVTKYLFDPAASQRLFADAGWTKGTDGILRNAAGDNVPFRCCNNSGDANAVKESLALVSELQGLGFAVVTPLPTPPPGASAVDQRQFITLNREGLVASLQYNQRGGLSNLTSASIAGPSNSWVGPNSGNWSNSAYDALDAQAAVTLDASQRQAVRLQQVQLLADQVPLIPLYFNPSGVIFRKGIVGPDIVPVLAGTITWNIQTWDVT